MKWSLRPATMSVEAVAVAVGVFAGSESEPPI
jgi:hypothetical protein